MKKTVLSLFAALLIGANAMAAPVSVGEAMQKAQAFVRQQAAKFNPGKAKAIQNAQLNVAHSFGSELHVFNIAGNNGFVIVSGDDRTEEILGYVDGGNFDINNIPDNMRFWLQMYADQIKALGNSNVMKAPKRTERAAVEHTCPTHWDQTSPFNNYILDDYPEQAQYYGDNLMTGCVATAMAQAMYTAAYNYKSKHGAWPTRATHTVPAYKITQTGIASTGWELPELPEYTFDWENMRTDNYSSIAHQDITDEQIKAVGKLMQYCGRSMKMEYDKVNSGAIAVYVAPRLYECLNMSKFVQSVDRAYFNSQDWEDMMYKEVSEGRAVVYSGQVSSSTSSEGHCFILDGYKDGLWHINWGWGKELAELDGRPKADGYFSLSVMQPMAGGSGAAGVTDAQYKYLQQATIGISYDDPEDGVSALNFYWKFLQMRDDYYRPSENSTSISGTFGVYNVFGATMDYDIGWAIRKADGTIEVVQKTVETVTCGSLGGKTWNSLSFSDLNIPTEDGQYDLVLASRVNGTETWYPCYGTDRQFIRVYVADGKVSKSEVHPMKITANTLKLANIDFIGDMEANKNNTVKITIENTGDDFFGTLAMYYSTGTSVETTKKYDQLATIKPGETTHEFIVNLPKGEYNLWFFANPSSYPSAKDAFYSGKMLIGFGADANKIQIGNLQFENTTDGTVNAKSLNGQLSPINGSFDVDNKAANTYSKTYYASIETEGSYYNPAQVIKTIEVPVSVAAGTKETINFTLDAEGLNASTTYVIRVYQKDGSDEVEVGKVNLKLAAWFRYWLADGTMKEAQEPSYYNPLDDEAKTAYAIDCRGLSSTTYMDDIANKNCLFYITADQKPTSSWNPIYGRCLVIDGVAEKMTIDADNGFYAPEEFTATEISYTHKFAVGNNDDGKGWETIILPFTVNTVKNGNKNLQWFHSKSDKRKHFWLMTFTGVKDNDLVFNYAQSFDANTPYLIAVPGDKWGDNWNLTDKDIVFMGKNVTVPVTELTTISYDGNSFVGMLETTTVNGWLLNADGSAFEQKEGELKGYTAYITTSGPAAAQRHIIIADNDATGIVTLGLDADDDAAVYNLNGMRVSNAQKGVYIKNGRKYVVK